jgi:hypothetical protein
VKTFTSRFGGNVTDTTAVAAVIWGAFTLSAAEAGIQPERRDE